MSTFPLTSFERILKKSGEKRVSEEALREFSIVMEEKMMKIAGDAALLAKHAGRKTILPEDVRLARKKV